MEMEDNYADRADASIPPPPFEFRIATAKILIELDEHQVSFRMRGHYTHLITGI